ncbi:hypothetical protein QBC40DRAFT_215086 [Triangularia verruculosa]|uniref:Transmembrane protein n=1 Tax=Triangularia verruculosa TaxID=2587418 RepID=A0AAN6XRH6_9PEZI|nr:hypothetical protein QBC40DRAFT_215086 [Triangularia verruculosa]
MAVCSLRRLVAVSVWLPVAHSHIAGSEQYNPTSPVETGLAPARVGHLELQQPPAPTPHARALFQRQSGENTCGFVGDSRAPFTCSAEWGAECRVNSAASAIGCCLSTACNIWTACLPYTSSRLASNRDADRTMYCSDVAEPECATLVYADGDYSGWTIPLCAATSVVLPIYDITSGSGRGTTTGGGSRSGVANPTDGVANPTDSVNDADNNNNRNLDTANSNGKTPEEAVASTVNTALIVGAVVGGVSFLAMVGIIIFLVIYCGRRKKRNQELRLQQQGPGGVPPLAGQPSTLAASPQQQMSIPDGSQPPPSFMASYSQQPADNRPSSIVKPAVHETVTPVGQVTPPAPGYNNADGVVLQPQYQQYQQGFSSPPPPVSPQFTGPGGDYHHQQQQQQQQPAMPVSPQVTGYGGYGGQQQQQQHQGHQGRNEHYPAHAVELGTQRGDGQVHEVQ